MIFIQIWFTKSKPDELKRNVDDDDEENDDKLELYYKLLEDVNIEAKTDLKN